MFGNGFSQQSQGYSPLHSHDGVNVHSHGGYSYSNFNTSNQNQVQNQPVNTGGSIGGQQQAGGGLGGILGSKAGLLSGLFNSLSGGLGGGSTSASGFSGYGACSKGSGAGGFGQIAKQVHYLAEKAIDSTGMGKAFAPIDKAVIHPLIWDPISKSTGVDVSSHPKGIPNVTNPLGVQR